MAAPLDLNNVQGDILLDGLPKKTQTFFFFQIKKSSVGDFRLKLGKLNHIITSVEQVQQDRKRMKEHRARHRELMPHCGVNIAFSSKGLKKIGVAVDEIEDPKFENGMVNDISDLSDDGTEWDARFKENIDGVILICGDSRSTVHQNLAQIKKLFSVGRKEAIIREVLSLIGDVRLGKHSGHEHFGFLDGVSQPSVEGVDQTPKPGEPSQIPQGRLLLGRDDDLNDQPITGDQSEKSRPDWALDGSFLAFRYLPQLVPEFDQFLAENQIPADEIPDPSTNGKELLGARLVGRWKNGSPVDITPMKSKPALSHANNFDFSVADPADAQVKCPFAAHIRKTMPRSDLNNDDAVKQHRIVRRGIPFGPEVCPEEKESHTTVQERGLLFVSYQSNLENGFHFIQKLWANNLAFPPHGDAANPGFDPIIGQNADDTPRSMTGVFSDDPSKSLNLGSPEFVQSKGGEYFFTPSIPTLKKFASMA